MQRIDEVMQEAFRAVLQDRSIMQIACDLYEVYGETRPFDTFYRELKSKFSKDTRTRFDFCDVLVICLLYGQFEPIYKSCELLGLERPRIADTTALLQAEMREFNESRARYQRAKRRVKLLTQESPTIGYVPPDITRARFAVVGGGS